MKEWNVDVKFERGMGKQCKVEFLLPPSFNLDKVDDPLGKFHYVNSTDFADKRDTWFAVESAEACCDLVHKMHLACVKQSTNELKVKLAETEQALMDKAKRLIH